MRSPMGNKRKPPVALAVALIFVCLSLRAGAGAPRAAPAPVVTVGVVAFQDESGAAVAPGTHRINVRLKGYGDAVATAVVSGGKRATLNLRLLPAASPAPVRIR